MKKSKYNRDATKALQALPPPPSAKMVKWDASLSVDDYYQEASKAIAQSETRLETFSKLSFPDEWHGREIASYHRAQSFLWEAKFQLLGDSFGVSRLLGRDNWASTRPRLSIFGAVNQRGNLTIVWKSPSGPLVSPDLQLENVTGFKDQFFRKCFYNTEAYGNSRPTAELLRFRNVPLTWHNDEDNPATRYIIYAIRSRYWQILRDVGHEIEIVEAARFEFLRDAHDLLECTVS